MKRNPDNDLVMFHNEVNYIEGTDIDTHKKGLYIVSSQGPTCEYSNKLVGSACCKDCPYCHGIKVRWWLSNVTGAVSSNGYVKCAKNNLTFLNKAKCFFWRLGGKNVIIKELKNE